MAKVNKFTPVDIYTARSEEGYEVHLPGPFALRYTEPGRFITFDSDLHVIEGVLPSLMVFTPHEPRWTSSGELIEEQDLSVLKENVVVALKEFDLYGVFISPRSDAQTKQVSLKE